MTQVVLFSKPGCHLCDDVKAVIERVGRSRQFEFQVRNIEDDAKDFSAYQHAIPVVMVDGGEIARYRLNEADLIRSLEARAG